jgi:Tfp pilus assembly pilus retraction ATPase PilT
MTLESSLATMIADGVIAYEDAMSVSSHPKELIRTLEQLELTRAKG